MIPKLSFLSHPFITILRQRATLIDGLERMIAIYFSDEQNRIIVTESAGIDGVDELNFGNSLPLLNEVRKIGARASWTNSTELPFHVRSEKKVLQMKIEDELDNRVLVLRFPASDGQNDLLYLFFGENLGPVKLSPTGEPISTDHKLILEKLLYNTVSLVIKDSKDNRLIFETINEANKQVTEDVTLLKANYKMGIRSLVKFLMQRLFEQNGDCVSLSTEALEKFSSYRGPVDQLETILKNAAIVASSRLLGLENNEIIINENDVVFKMDTKGDKLAERSNKTDRYTNTASFLDRYEEAMRKVIDANLKVTGENLGQACLPQVSPAAISDLLKKHRKKIITLFGKYPERWQLLRAQFRPVKKLAEQYSAQLRSAVGA